MPGRVACNISLNFNETSKCLGLPPPSSSMEITFHCRERCLHGPAIIKPSWKMHQRQFHKTTIYFLKSENTTHNQIPTYQHESKQSHHLTQHSHTHTHTQILKNPNWKYCRDKKGDKLNAHLLRMWKLHRSNPAVTAATASLPAPLPGSSTAGVPWKNALTSVLKS